MEISTYDHAYLRVSNDGSIWHTVWENVDYVEDSSWVYQEFDIAAYADGQSTVYLRWTMGTTDTGWQYCGWNIDDVQIYGVEQVAVSVPESPSGNSFKLNNEPIFVVNGVNVGSDYYRVSNLIDTNNVKSTIPPKHGRSR